MIEDSVNRCNLIFETPRQEKYRESIYVVCSWCEREREREREMLAKGPDLVAELLRNLNKLKIPVFKGRKTIFHENVLLGKHGKG